MENITEELSAEHQTILKVIDAMINECDQLKNGKKLNTAFFEKVIDFIKNYADRYHHAKEEDILFTTMLANLDGMHCNPIPVMLHEHESGREYVKGLEEGLTENNIEMIIENAMLYCQLLQDHIYKEDNILYPMAEEALDDQQKLLVLEKYNEVTSNNFSDEDIQKYLSVLDT